MPVKGGNFEREVCKTLSLWWSGGTDDSLFWRTAMSGGRATVRARKGKTTAGHCGDICSTDPSSVPLLKFLAFEVKRGYNKVTLSGLMDLPDRLKQQELEAWFEQAERSAELSQSVTWMIIHKRDGREPVVIFPADLEYWLANHRDCRLSFRKPFMKVSILTKVKGSANRNKKRTLCCMWLADFLDVVPPSAFGAEPCPPKKLKPKKLKRTAG